MFYLNKMIKESKGREGKRDFPWTGFFVVFETKIGRNNCPILRQNCLLGGLNLDLPLPGLGLDHFTVSIQSPDQFSSLKLLLSIPRDD